jgi:hypothetical protein
MGKLTEQKIDLMEIVNVIFRNGYWHVLIVDSERIGYKVFFEGLEIYLLRIYN